MLKKIFCLFFSSVAYCGSSIQGIPAPNLEGKEHSFLRNYAKQIQPRIDAGELEDILDLKTLFSPGFGIFKNIIPTQLSTRPERDARYCIENKLLTPLQVISKILLHFPPKPVVGEAGIERSYIDPI